MVIFKINHAGIAQTHPENYDATNAPHLFAVTTNGLVVTTNGLVGTTNNYKRVFSNYKQLQTDLL